MWFKCPKTKSQEPTVCARFEETVDMWPTDFLSKHPHEQNDENSGCEEVPSFDQLDNFGGDMLVLTQNKFLLGKTLVWNQQNSELLAAQKGWLLKSFQGDAIHVWLYITIYIYIRTIHNYIRNTMCRYIYICTYCYRLYVHFVFI